VVVEETTTMLANEDVDAQAQNNFYSSANNNKTMNTPNRDLLVLAHKANLTQVELEHEVELLHELLFVVENTTHFCVAHELIDINRYRIINNHLAIQSYISVFISCKN
jgi:hypothetical protein